MTRDDWMRGLRREVIAACEMGFALPTRVLLARAKAEALGLRDGQDLTDEIGAAMTVRVDRYDADSQQASSPHVGFDCLGQSA